MRGLYHIQITFAFAVAIILPFGPNNFGFDFIGLLPPGLWLWTMFLAALGSLIPDVDASDAKFFYEFGNWGNFFKYLIYNPIARFYGEKKHRGIMHSIPGMVATIVLFLAYILLGLLLLFLIELLLPSFSILSSLINFLAGFEDVAIDLVYILMFVGCTIFGLGFGLFAHLWEDATTVSGVKWFPSAESADSGYLRVGGKNEKKAFGIYSGVGFSLIILDLLILNLEWFVSLAISLLALIIFILLGFFFCHPLWYRLVGEDTVNKRN